MKMNRKQHTTELVFILDRSGSMSGLESDTISGFNHMLAEQKSGEGQVNVTTVLFDDQIQLLHDRRPIQEVMPITRQDYYVRGCTALLDAVGMSISRLVETQRRLTPEQRADRVMFVITTDGWENASREYSWSRVKNMITYEQEAYGWEFLFLGANLDAAKTAGDLGIHPSRAAQFHNDSQGIKTNYSAVSKALHKFRKGSLDPACSACADDWKAEIEQDFASR